jgi:hypothetical protein
MRGATVMQKIGDDWVVVMEWPDGVENGGPARLVIEPIDKMPVGGLSSTVLRRIDFRRAVDNFREQVRRSDTYHISEKALDELKVFERDQLRSAMTDGVTEHYLALLAWHYVRAAERGQANINDYLADLVGKPVGTVRGHLIRARHDGLLSGRHGKKGGELSNDALKVVKPYAQAWTDEYDRLFGDSALNKFFEEVAPETGDKELPPGSR